MNHASLWSCLRASTLLEGWGGKCLRQCFSHPHMSQRCLCPMLLVQSGKGAESACSQVCSAWLRHFGDSGMTGGEVQKSCKVPKVTWGKTKQNLSSTSGRSSVMYLYWKKRKMKIETTSSHLAELCRPRRKGCCGCRELRYRRDGMAGLGNSHNEKDTANII